MVGNSTQEIDDRGPNQRVSSQVVCLPARVGWGWPVAGRHCVKSL